MKRAFVSLVLVLALVALGVGSSMPHSHGAAPHSQKCCFCLARAAVSDQPSAAVTLRPEMPSAPLAAAARDIFLSELSPSPFQDRAPPLLSL